MEKNPGAMEGGGFLLRELFWNSSLAMAVMDDRARLLLASKTFRESFPTLITVDEPERLRLQECPGGSVFFSRAASVASGERFSFPLRFTLAGADAEVVARFTALHSRCRGRPLFLSEWLPAADAASLSRSLEEVEQRYRTLQENLPVGIYRADQEGNILTANGALLRMMGYGSFEELQTASLQDVWVDPSQRTALIAHLARHGSTLQHEVHLRRRDGTELIGAFDARGIFDVSGRLLYFDTIVQDITARVQATRALERLARTDGLTGLFNRQHFFARFEEEAARALRYRRPLSLLIVDLDRFKDVNDRFGHLAGDAVLVSTAARLRLVMRESDFAGRYGGEEFCVALPETDRGGALESAERLHRAVSDGDHVLPGGRRLSVTCSIGVAEIGNGGSEEVFARADAALYAAKNGGRDRVVAAAPPE